MPTVDSGRAYTQGAGVAEGFFLMDGAKDGSRIAGGTAQSQSIVPPVESSIRPAGQVWIEQRGGPTLHSLQPGRDPAVPRAVTRTASR